MVGRVSVSKTHERPIGITAIIIIFVILATLYIIGFLIALYNGYSFIQMKGYNCCILNSFYYGENTLSRELMGPLTVPLSFISDFSSSLPPEYLYYTGLVTAVVTLITLYGFLKGKKWSRWVAIILAILTIFSSIVIYYVIATGSYGVGEGSLLSAVISILILYYLTTNSVKQWFSA